jgi:pteridine reductase
VEHKVALITGAARRIGAETARMLHANGMNIILHCRSSLIDAEQLAADLNQSRANSAKVIQADLHDMSALGQLAEEALQHWGRLDLLVNNASSFYETPFSEVTEAQWDELLGSNLKAPFFLSKAVASALKEAQGSIINIVDIHAERPLANFSTYSIAKAGLVAMTRSLALELGPDIRVNGIAPGAILWPEQGLTEGEKTEMLSRIPLARKGAEKDIAETVCFLALGAGYISGQIIAVDGGRSICA